MLHIMACAKQAAEAEQLGGKLLQLCRKKAPEKELLRVLEVRNFKNHISARVLRCGFSSTKTFTFSLFFDFETTTTTAQSID